MKKIFIALFMLSISLLYVLGNNQVYAAETVTPFTDEFAAKKIIWLGDSITVGFGASDNDHKFVNIVAEELGFLESVNYGVGGATISQYVDGVPNFIDIAATMDTDADYVVVFGGINDYYNLVPIGVIEDTDPTVSFYGALNTLIPSLETTYPTARIILVSPYSASSATPTSYAAAMKERAYFYDVEFIDMFKHVGFDLHNEVDQELYAIDTVHLNDLGNRRLADIFVSYLYDDYTENLVVAATVNADKSLSTTGGLVESPSFSVTDYMAVEPGKTYVYTSYDYAGSSRAVSWYDSEKAFIKNTLNSDTFVVAPENAAFARLQTYLVAAADINFSKIVNYDYDVEFFSDGGTEIATQYVTEYRDVVAPSNPTKTGYTFIGWYDTSEFDFLFDFDGTVTEDITLYAKWAVASTGGLTPAAPAETLSFLGVAWYWWTIGIVGVYYFFISKKGRKSIGLK